MALDRALVRLGLCDIRPDGTLCKPFCALDLASLVCKHIDEGLSDGLALELRILDTLACSKETVGGTYTDDIETHALITCKDILEFVLSKQTVVHEDANQVMADGLVNKKRCHRRVNAAGKSEDDGITADLIFDLRNGSLNELLRIQFFSVIHKLFSS